jgi:peptidoglycan/xylan/chitin deacetylase (PgdA/CDA1 family)
MKCVFPALMVFFLLTGCSAPNVLGFFTTETPTPAPSATDGPTITPTATATFTPSPTQTLTPLPTATPTPMLTVKGPGNITCPILLYHRIVVPDVPNEYFVIPDDFRAQMQALKDWGYTPIPISLLIEAINVGAPLPDRPVVISFDDGDITVYTTAFPIMKEFGYTGINYIVGNRLAADGFMTPAQIKEMIAAGWEVGSHSMTHKDLTTKDPSKLPDLKFEISQSKSDLENALGTEVSTFAYPFGLGYESETIMEKVRANYSAAVGLGAAVDQGPGNIFYLWRRPVKYGWDAATLGSYLPWNTPPGNK